jgi:hypothetical protein
VRVTYKAALSDSDSKFGKDTVMAGDYSYASRSQTKFGQDQTTPLEFLVVSVFVHGT